MENSGTKTQGGREMVVKIWKLLQPFHKIFAWYGGLILVYESLQIMEGYVISASIRLFGMKADMLAWVAFVAVLVIYDQLFMRLDNYLDWYIITKQIYPISKFLKTSALGKFLGMDMTWHQERNSGTLVGKVNNGVEKVQDILEGGSWEMFPAVTQAVLSLVALLIFNPLTALFMSIALGIFLQVSLSAVRARQPLRSQRYDLYEEEWHKSVENVQFVETSVMFGQQHRLYDEYCGLHDRIMAIGSQEARLGIFKYNRRRICLMSLTRRLILVVWVWQLYNGHLDVAGLVYMSVLTEKLFSTFWRFARLMDRAAEAGEGAERLSGLMAEQPGMQDGFGSVPSPLPPKIGIDLQHVSFSYPSSGCGLKDIDLKIEPGQMVALVGPSGSGKTTLRKLVTRMFDIHQGKLLVGDLDVRQWPLERLRALFSYVPQGDDVHIFNDTIAYNIGFSKPDAIRYDIEKAAKLAGIHATIMHDLPQGYETIVGERGVKLSGGQKQRVALARAFLANRPILILDEATSAVDAITEREIQEQLKIALAGRTAIVIAHRLSTVWGIADKIVVLDCGHKVEEGSHEQLMANGGLYAEMVKLQI